MSLGGELFNIVLGLAAVAYSFIPPHRITHYRPGVARLMRGLGLALVGLAAISLLLKTLPSS